MHIFNFKNILKKEKSEKLNKTRIYDTVMISLTGLLAACLAIVVVSQIMLKSETARVYLTNISKFENVSSVDVFGNNGEEERYVDLIVENCIEKDLKNVYLYVNGENKGCFTDLRKRVYVTGQSVIEIENKNNYPVSVYAEKFGDGVESVLNNSKAEIFSFGVITRVILK